ncbi:MAG: tetratricopeptide repeat protein [Peptococcaceae bacterium]|jgi:tetratricopeptide (TPR) repeat protein|nr:tetratricopeptide repeat protein [Peptococcaceae bacterium]MDH7525515.1 tetratricopeptide repeat protein [Peptococcaceae bacterium]
MLVTGLLVTGGALLEMAISGFKAWVAGVLAAGAAMALLSSHPVRSRLCRTAAGLCNSTRMMAISAMLVGIVLAAPAVFGPGETERLDREVKKSASLLAAGDLDGAERLLDTLADKYPEVPQIWLNLSTVYLKKGKPEKAAALLEARKQYRLFNADELFNYAMSYYQRKQYQEALINLKKALQQDPDMVDAFLYAAECARRLGDYKAARHFARQFVEMKPQIPLGHLQLARVQLMVMNYRGALVALETALALKPDEQLKQEIIGLKEEANYYLRQAGGTQ